MNKLFSRTSAALACALSLAACGGDDGNLQLGGTIYGVTKTGLTLSNNGGPALAIVPGQSSFYFPDAIGSDERYDVKVKDLPEGMTCESRYASGTSGAYSVTSVQFFCANVPRNLSGKVQNLTGGDLILNNGRDRLKVTNGSTTFKFTQTAEDGKTLTGQVGDGEPFGITVLEQPKGQTCTVSNGSGIMGHVDYDLAVVTCN